MTPDARRLAITYQTIAAVMSDRARFWGAPGHCTSKKCCDLAEEFQYEANHFYYLARLWMGVES